jgi:hypothetical protein
MATDVPDPEDSRNEAILRLELELEAIAAAQAEGLFFSFHDDRQRADLLGSRPTDSALHSRERQP